MARSKKIRWLSGVVGLALAISGVMLLAGSASSTPQLPPVSPQQLPASMAPAARARGPISGEVPPSTAVSVAQARRVAGRGAYVLVLQPRTSDTLVGRVEISFYAARRVPLGVDVFPRGVARAAISVDFTSVSFAPIKPSAFDFVPPAGARIVRPSLPSIGAEGQTAASVPAQAKPEDFVRVLGKGWAEILAVRLPASSTLAQRSRGSALTSLLPFSGPLFSVRLVDRGDHSWLIGGLVPQDALARVEAKLP